MTDRELLELAAKAAGYSYNTQYFDEQVGIIVWEPPIWYEGRDWNPLREDNDAARLLIAIRGKVAYSTTGVTIAVGRHGWHQPFGDDPMAAFRRAVVDTAAQVGASK